MNLLFGLAQLRYVPGFAQAFHELFDFLFGVADEGLDFFCLGFDKVPLLLFQVFGEGFLLFEQSGGFFHFLLEVFLIFNHFPHLAVQRL